MTTLSEGVTSAAKTAAEAWAAAMQIRRQPCVMKPWEENEYCLTPVVTNFVCPSATPTPLVPENPMRVALFICQDAGTPNLVYFQPGAPINPAAPQGVSVRGTTLPFVVFQQDHLNLCSVEWHALAPGTGVNITCIEVILRDWPR